MVKGLWRARPQPFGRQNLSIDEKDGTRVAFDGPWTLRVGRKTGQKHFPRQPTNNEERLNASIYIFSVIFMHEMSDEDAAQLSESLLSPEAGEVGAETQLARGADDDPHRLLGMKKRTAYVVLGSAAVLLVTGVTLAIIYGRPPSWKETASLSSPDVDGNSVGISGDGSVVAFKLRTTDAVGYDPNNPYLWDGVELVSTGKRDLGSSGGQYFRPFPVDQEQYPLPFNSKWGDVFEPSYVTTDFALSENADVFVIKGHALLYDNWQYEKQSYRGLCNTFGSNATDREGYDWFSMDCRYTRLATYTRDRGASDRSWNHEPVGRPIEIMTSDRRPDETSGQPTVVKLSADGKTLALGYAGRGNVGYGPSYAGRVEVYDYDEGEETKWRRVGEIKGDGNDASFGGSVSLNEDGSRVAIGGFGGKKVFVYGRNDKGDSQWRVLGGAIEGSGPGDFGLTVSLSKAGDRLAVVVRDVASETKYDSDVPYDKLDAARVQVFELVEDDNAEWKRLGNDITGFKACCSDSGAGSGVTISGDGTTVVVAGGLDRNHVATHRYDGGEWKSMGKSIELVDKEGFSPVYSAASLTTDGRTLAVANSSRKQYSGEEQSTVRLFSFRRGVRAGGNPRGRPDAN